MNGSHSECVRRFNSRIIRNFLYPSSPSLPAPTAASKASNAKRNSIHLIFQIKNKEYYRQRKSSIRMMFTSVTLAVRSLFFFARFIVFFFFCCHCCCCWYWATGSLSVCLYLAWPMENCVTSLKSILNFHNKNGDKSHVLVFFSLSLFRLILLLRAMILNHHKIRREEEKKNSDRRR